MDIDLLIDTDKRVIFGAKETIKALRRNEVDQIFLAKNCPSHIYRLIESLALANEVKVQSVNLSSEELSMHCKKTFSVAVASIAKMMGK